MIQFICVTLMMIYVTYLTDFQFLVSDLFIIFPLEWFLAMTHPYDTLTYHYPVSGLLSFPVISSIIVQTILTFVFQFVGYHILRNHYGFENICDFDDNEDPLPCHENTIFFLIAHFQYLIMAIAFSVSKPFRQRIYKNWALMIYLVLIFFYSIWITINCDDWSLKLFNLYDLKYKGETDDEEEEGEEETGNQNENDVNDADDGDDEGEDEGDNDLNEEEENKEEEEEESDIIEGGDKMKYYVLLIVGINMIVNIFVEWVIMRLINNCYENRLIQKYKEEVEQEKLIEAQNNSNNNPNKINDKEVKIFKYQRIYYYDRRKKIEMKEKNEKKNEANKVEIYSSSRNLNKVN